MSEAARLGRAAAGTAGDGGEAEEGGPFRLAKSLSIAAIALIFAAALALAAVLSRQAEKIIATRVEEDTVKLMENLNHQMFYGFLMPARFRFGRIALRQPEQQEFLNEVVTRTIYGFDIKRVVIYDPEGEAVYATDKTILRSPVDDRLSFDRAVELYWSDLSKNLWLYLQDLWRFSLKLTAERRLKETEAALAGQDEGYQPPDPRLFLNPAEADDAGGKARPPLEGDAAAGLPLAGGEPEGLGELGLAGPKTVYEAPNLYERFLGGRDFRRRLEEALSRPEELPSAAGPGWDDGPEEALLTWFWSRLQSVGQNPSAARDEKFMETLRRRTVHRYEGGRRLFFNFFPRGEVTLRGYKAMENYGARGLSGVLEIDRDLTAEYSRIAWLQYFALGAAALLSLLLTLALRWVLNRGEAVIRRRDLERQALRRRLDQAERLAGLGGMVATVAHEIRNPLGIIHSTADVLRRFMTAEPEKARLAEIVIEEADRLSEVVTEFLDFARPQEPKLEPVAVEEILEETLASLEIALARASVELRADFREERTPILADAHMLRRAFLNIFVNALQAMDDEGGLLSVAARREADGRVWVEISDTGPGLSEEAARKAFAPFFTTKAKGTGLGLVIVRNIVEAHGGEIDLFNGRREADEGPPGLTVRLGFKTRA